MERHAVGEGREKIIFVASWSLLKMGDKCKVIHYIIFSYVFENFQNKMAGGHKTRLFLRFLPLTPCVNLSYCRVPD